MSEIMIYLSFHAWIPSLSKMSTRFINVVASDKFPSFKRLNNIPLLYISHLLYLFIHWWTLRLLLSWVMLQWMWEYSYLFEIFHFLWIYIYPQVGLLELPYSFSWWLYIHCFLRLPFPASDMAPWCCERDDSEHHFYHCWNPGTLENFLATMLFNSCNY